MNPNTVRDCVFVNSLPPSLVNRALIIVQRQYLVADLEIESEHGTRGPSLGKTGSR